MSEDHGRITAELFEFLAELAANNDRTWFNGHKARYEEVVREPLRAFVRDFEPFLEELSPHMVADDRKVGGSLFRIHRDVRFSRDRSPYKTWAALQFRHEAGKDVHGPGFYLHLQPDNVFMGAGCWHPAREALERIRDAIVEDPDRWLAVRDEAQAAGFTFEGASLKRPPRGYPTDHPAVEELKRKDFIVVRRLSEAEACRPDFARRFAAICVEAEGVMSFLAAALGLRW